MRLLELSNLMPFVEIIGIKADAAELSKIATGVTAAVVNTLSVPAETVTIYFTPSYPTHYAHGGSIIEPARQRIFVKLNILARSIGVRRRAAAAVCDAVAMPINHNQRDIAIYFLERSIEEVSHAGILECDRLTSDRTHIPVVSTTSSNFQE